MRISYCISDVCFADLFSATSLQAANVPPPTSAAPAAITPRVFSTVLRFIPNLLGCGASEGGRFRHSLLAGQGDHISPTNLRSAPPLRVGVVSYKGIPKIGDCPIEIGSASCRERECQYV